MGVCKVSGTSTARQALPLRAGTESPADSCPTPCRACGLGARHTRSPEKGATPRPRASYALSVRRGRRTVLGPGLLTPPSAGRCPPKGASCGGGDHDFVRLRHVLPQASRRVDFREVESGWKLWDFEFCRLRDAEALHDKFFKQMKDIEEVRCLHMEEIQKEMRRGLTELRSEVEGLRGFQSLRDTLAASLQPILDELSELREAVVTQVQPSKVAACNVDKVHREEHERQQEEAATKIQAVHRGNMARKDVQDQHGQAIPKIEVKEAPKQQQEEAATKIQAVHRGNVARKEGHHRQEKAAQKIQADQDPQKHEEDAATKIQAVHRGNLARKEHDAQQKEAKQVQANTGLTMLCCHVPLHVAWVLFSVCLEEEQDRQQEQAATKIQAVHRGNVARKEHDAQQKEAKQVQANTGLTMLCCHVPLHVAWVLFSVCLEEEQDRQQEQAATKIQAVHRGNVARKETQGKQEKAACKIQDRQQEEAATKIQAVHRGNLARKEKHQSQEEKATSKDQEDRRQQEEAATKIQAHLSGKVAVLEASAETTVREFKERLLGWNCDNELTRMITSVEMMAGSRQLSNEDETLKDAGVSSEAGLHVVFRQNIVECAGKGEAHDFDLESGKTLVWVNIPEGHKKTRHGAFENCASVAGVTIPDSVTQITHRVFASCGSLRSVTIPSSVTRIGVAAFERCFSLTSVGIPNSVTQIDRRAFAACTALTSVRIPNSLTQIGPQAFEACGSLTSVVIPNSVMQIGQDAFRDCRSLTSVAIPDSVTKIGASAFAECSSLTSVTIPSSVTQMGDYAFFGCSSLTSVAIPNSVTQIGQGTFHHCSSLTSVEIPKSVTEIGRHAFVGCSSLTSVVIPDSVTQICQGAFTNCRSLTSVTIPDSVTHIADCAFTGCSFSRA
ncbi:BSPAL1 [Symbiodinium natans]|uniref:BSPAL1 protein n=1 Tax=Symbiodinium natans TaxID=878477 RepID=A0A812S724_9DINO|nr:BSPAL1 [Symbiodinium natans]